jgi:mycothiol synthase
MITWSNRVHRVTDSEPIEAHQELSDFEKLSDHQQAEVRALADAATSVDGVGPVSEHVLLSLKATPAGARHLLLGPAGQLKGYAYRQDGPDVREVELVVHPDHRGSGHGRALLEAAATGSPGGAVLVWAHGDHPAARALARSLGYRPVRTLLQLRRPLEDFDAPAFPAGASLRTFRPGTDDAEWLRLNARAFAHHPEQGRTTRADLQARMDEPWFDPKGFLIAERDGVMIGFHWTKVHPGGLGEVYVVGVDPDLHSQGLGRALTLAGLRHLHAQGLRTVLLYVEADNAPALAIYRRLGFKDWSIDVMYARGPEPAA